DVADVLDRLHQPVAHRLPAGRGDAVDHPVRAALAAFEASLLDQTLLLEPLERLVDERAAERPDRAHLASAGEALGEGPAADPGLGDEGEDRPVAGVRRAVHARTVLRPPGVSK